MDHSITSLIIVSLIILTGTLFKKKELNWDKSEKFLLIGAIALLVIATFLNLQSL
ncbi:MAG: hypothetical protein ACRC5Q_04290 [Culicoidibacterales bacterium]